MKIRSVEELEDFVGYDYTWRRKELTNLRNLVLSSKKHNQEILLRSAIPLLYAHWEGLVKQISIAMLQYLVSKGFKYSELKPTFLAYAVLEKHQGQFPSKNNFDALANLFCEGGVDIYSSIQIDPSRYIDTKSNLNSEVLKDITKKIGVDYSLFELKENLINESFLGLRNKICHGERAKITSDEFNILYDEVITLINTFKNAVLNCVHQQSYLSSDH